MTHCQWWVTLATLHTRNQNPANNQKVEGSRLGPCARTIAAKFSDKATYNANSLGILLADRYAETPSRPQPLL